jgi:cell division protein FtsQ
MKFNWNKITISIMLISSGFAFYSFNKKNENRLTKGLDISILPSQDSYLSKDSITSILNPFLGDEKKSIDLNLIENIVDNNSYVDKSEVSLSFSGKLVLKIKQKTPVGRVISENEMFYVDKDLRKMDLSKHQSARVPIIIGFENEISRSYLKRILELINDDAFLEQNISKIIINSPNRISLKLRAYDIIVNMGDQRNLKNKFLKLRAFYTRANAKKKLIEFKQINLQFDNQVVGVKNNSYVKK